MAEQLERSGVREEVDRFVQETKKEVLGEEAKKVGVGDSLALFILHIQYSRGFSKEQLLEELLFASIRGSRGEPAYEQIRGFLRPVYEKILDRLHAKDEIFHGAREPRLVFVSESFIHLLSEVLGVKKDAFFVVRDESPLRSPIKESPKPKKTGFLKKLSRKKD